MSTLTDEILRRRTFAIISHPDAGKVASLGDEAVKLAPHIYKLAEWLGSEWSSLLS